MWWLALGLFVGFIAGSLLTAWLGPKIGYRLSH